MTGVNEIILACNAAISAGLDHVQIVVQKGVSSKIKGFGKSQLCCVNHKGDRVFWYNAKKVKAACELVKILSQVNDQGFDGDSVMDTLKKMRGDHD